VCNPGNLFRDRLASATQEQLDSQFWFDRTIEKFTTTLRIVPILFWRFHGFISHLFIPPLHWRKASWRAWIYSDPAGLPNSLVPEEFVMDPVPAPFGGMLDPSQCRCCR
jgi:hypothetical protein